MGDSRAQLNWLDTLPPEVIETIWFYVHRNNLQKIRRIINRIHTKICLWRNPSERLLDLVTIDMGCLQHPYTDFYKFRNKDYCDSDGLAWCSYSPSYCVHCSIIRRESPWTDMPPDGNLYKCGNCEEHGFPCGNCAMFFNGWIKPEIFYANF